MNYGSDSQDEMEVTIRLDREDRQAHICSTLPEWSRKLERLYGSPKKVTERDRKATSAFWVVPLTAIRVRPTRASGRRVHPTGGVRCLSTLLKRHTHHEAPPGS